MPTLTLRGLSVETLKKLKQRARVSGLSMNKLIIQKLEDEVGGGRKRIHHGLDPLFGTMTAEDCDAVCDASRQQRKVDPEMWS